MPSAFHLFVYWITTDITSEARSPTPEDGVDHDQVVSDEVRFVQMTPPGSACSIAFGKGLTQMQPGSLDNLQMVIADADATHADLVARGIEVSDVDELAWGRFVFFADPDGNGWALQQLPDWLASAGGEGYEPEA
jgi:uncharacterized glyoxalase superfamily protein PhnB